MSGDDHGIDREADREGVEAVPLASIKPTQEPTRTETTSSHTAHESGAVVERPPAHPDILPAAESAPFTIYVVLAAFNESRMIAEVVRQVIGEYGNVVVVDDGSSDDTADRARSAGAVVLRHPVNRGQGAALQTAIEYSLTRGADCIVTFDSDGQHRVEDIEVLTRPIRRGQCDIVMGSRFLGQTENMPWTRGVLLQAGVLFTRVFSGIRVTDAHNGLRAFSRRAAEGVDIRLDRMAHASELMDFVGQSGLAYMEVPVHIRYTDYSKAKGQSSSGAFRIAFDYLVGSLMR